MLINSVPELVVSLSCRVCGTQIGAIPQILLPMPESEEEWRETARLFAREAERHAKTHANQLEGLLRNRMDGVPAMKSDEPHGALSPEEIEDLKRRHGA